MPVLPSLQRVPTASIPLGGWIMDVVRNARIPLPRVRKTAVLESLRCATSIAEITEIFFETTSDSPYLDDRTKQELGELLLSQDWECLRNRAVGEEETSKHDSNATTFRAQQLAEFKEMAIGIMQTSRVVKRLPESRRKEIVRFLLAAQSKPDMVEYLLHSLEQTNILDEATRHRIIHDVLEKRFYRLLLPDRFHCDERPRLSNDQPQQEECVLCFGMYYESIQLDCGHDFCQPCLQEISKRHDHGPFPCPMCRRSCCLIPEDCE